MLAEEIGDLPAGSIVRINGTDWIRMRDSGHSEGPNGCIFNPNDGDWMNWSHLCLADDEVELIRNGGLTNVS